VTQKPLVSTEPAIVAESLHKSYGEIPAVAGLDLQVPAGQIFGFLGPNGAGKSTTIGILCTLLRPDSGHALVAGYDVIRHPDEVRRNISVVFQEGTLDRDLTARQNLRFQANLFGLHGAAARAAIASALELVDLTSRKDSPISTYSGGMQRRLEIARGLIHAPRVLFLDEPTTGLDPQTRVAIWEHLHRLRAERDVTIFLTTHHLEEAENCDAIVIIDGGKRVAEGTPAELKAVVGEDLVILRTGDDNEAARAVHERFGLAASVGPDGLRLRVPDGARLVPRLCAELSLPIHSVTVTSPTLDDVFLHYTGRSIRDADTGPSLLSELGMR
jgi:ABC-2 type transport system ATP-binding protein